MVTLVLAYDPEYTVLSNRFTLVNQITVPSILRWTWYTVPLAQYLLILLTVPGTEYPEVASIGTWPSYSIAIIPD